MKTPVSIIRSLQQLSQNGHFKIFAIDHRDVFVDMVKSTGRYVNDSSVRDEKLSIIKEVAPLVSGYLVDPFYSLPECITNKCIPSEKGFMVNLENNDYSVENIGSNYCIKDLSPETIKKMGASAVKLFMYYHPESEYANASEKEIERIGKLCENAGIPFLIEPVLYSLNGETLPADEYASLTKKMVSKLKKYPITIFKINFPGSVDEFDEKKNLAICREITDMLDVPWVIMSSDIESGVFEKQLEYACRGGASGYVAGRSVWKEYVTADDDKRKAELENMSAKLNTINKIVDRYAFSWEEKIKADSEHDDLWYAKL